MSLIAPIMLSSWQFLQESSIFILFGFLMAGILKAFISDEFVGKHLGRNSFITVVKASLLGIPLPLCSCGVIPAAAGLKKQGASKGATAAFLISTPETGVDSIAITYALLDPVMTILRPVAAFFTATFAGALVNLTDKPEKEEIKKDFETCAADCYSRTSETASIWQKLSEGIRYAFTDLFSDIAGWLVAGILIAGVISAFLSPDFVSEYLGEGLFPMIVMLVISIPLYICATASTPIAAALALKGLSPGAAMVLLLAGPATNIATLTVITKLLGKGATVIYVLSIAVCSLAIGYATNLLYAWMGLDITRWVESGGAEEHGIIYTASSLIFIGLIIYNMVRKKKQDRESCVCKGLAVKQ